MNVITESRTYSSAIEFDSVVAERAKIFFAPTAKVANTSIKFALAQMEGTLTGAISAKPHVSQDQTIHDPAVNGMRSLSRLNVKERAEVLRDPSWIRFCITRSPYERVLSG